MLALGTEVAREALAQTSRVVADAAAGAVATLRVPVAHEDVGAGRALLEGAVRSAESHVANAAHVLHGIPRRGVGLRGLGGQLLLGVADAAPRAVVRAHGTLTTNTIVVVEALALSGLAVADALVGALYFRVSLVGGGRHRDPRSSLGAGAQGAVRLRPGSIAVGALVAHALVVAGARTVAGAPVRAVGVGDGREGGESDEDADHCAS